MKKTAVMILPSGSVELQNSEVACCHKYASVSPCDTETLDLKAPKNTCEMEQYGLLKSSEINFVTDKNDYPSQTEEWVLCFSLAFDMYAILISFFFLLI
jgi:hypothetical protein